MQVALVIFCSCLSAAYFTYNLSFQSLASHVSHFENSHDEKNNGNTLAGVAWFFQLPRMRKNTSTLLPIDSPTLTTAVTQGILPWIALARGTGLGHRVSDLAG